MKPSLVAAVAVTLGLVSSAYGQGPWFQVAGGDWVPNAETLHPLQSGLEAYVRGRAKIEHRTLRAWNSYTFQYQGRNEDGRKYVLVNAMCITDDTWDLEKRVVVVLDGGSCFFNLKYDPNKQHYYGLTINNEA